MTCLQRSRHEMHLLTSQKAADGLVIIIALSCERLAAESCSPQGFSAK